MSSIWSDLIMLSCYDIMGNYLHHLSLQEWSKMYILILGLKYQICLMLYLRPPWVHSLCLRLVEGALLPGALSGTFSIFCIMKKPWNFKISYSFLCNPEDIAWMVVLADEMLYTQEQKLDNVWWLHTFSIELLINPFFFRSKHLIHIL